jgi:hypothetical protein
MIGLGTIVNAAAIVAGGAAGLYQGTITLLSVFIAPYLSVVVVTQMSLIGSVLILASVKTYFPRSAVADRPQL